ncbi:MAG: DUF885 domain-containing protein [Terricaulis sp.]|nr:DUF885 domain-containing protein [Terricaulis sp.]
MLFDRRDFLIAGAALAGCASTGRTAQTDAAFHALVEAHANSAAPARWHALRGFDARALSPQGQILRASIFSGAEADAALAQLGYSPSPYAVTQRNGAYRSASPNAEAIARDTAQLEADAARGIIAPDFILEAALPLVEAAAAARAPQDAAAALTAQAAALRLLRTQASAEAGAWRLPHGEAFYLHALQFYLGAPVEPIAAHQAALAHATALHSQADAILRQHGLTRGGVGERLRALANSPRAHIPANEAGRRAALAEMHRALERARAFCAPAFTRPLPPASVRAAPMAEEADGTRGRREAGAYIVDLGGPRALWSLATVVYHETLPGHGVEAAYQANAQAPALQRRYSSGFSEGWATYAEMLADRLGAYEGDALARLGYLHWMLFRVGRIVIDTGMHALRWSRARCIAEMREIQGESIAFVSIEDDVSRIAAQPGAAAAQGLAALHLAKIAPELNAALPRFHDAALSHGPLSPPGLEAALRAAA